MNCITPLIRPWLMRRVKDAARWQGRVRETQTEMLQRLVSRGRDTRWGMTHGLDRVVSYEDFLKAVPEVVTYDKVRPYIMRMVNGERDVLWPGWTRNFAQSSGTSDGKSKYIPVTPESFRWSHYRGGADVVAHYLNLYPDSRIFSGKAFILGGSFANELTLPPGVEVGDLSANLIENINPLVNMFRIPSKEVALMSDWKQKLPALVNASLHENVTNISGVPSWFMTVLKEVIKAAGATTIHDVWPNLEVFFHGGISFDPYREQYHQITDPSRMRYIETYNASEGFFALQNEIDDRSLLLLLDAGTFYEFIPVEEADSDRPTVVPAWKVEEGRVYEMVITSCNGLWRYRLGDTVKIEHADPLKITIAGRTKHYINAFGEELMVYNADAAIARVEKELNCDVVNYTAAPVYAGDRTRGRHEWLIEFTRHPVDIAEFARRLDSALQDVNSDYQAKRSGGIFLDQLTVDVGRRGVFDRWLSSTGKLGGQRKVPRLCNDRRFLDPLLALNKELRMES